jgi:sugar lactone lactonase YvrE
MRAFAAVAFREIAERRFVLVAAAAAAVIPFLVPLLPGVPTDQLIAARSITALTIAFIFGIGGSLLVGASVVGRELAEKRLSFHFSRPIPGPALWAGKLLGGLAVALLAEAIVVLPTAALIGGIPSFGDAAADPEYLRELLFVSVPLFLLAWIGSVALRSRSRWLVVDAVLLLAALPALLFIVGHRFLSYGGRVAPIPVLAPLVGLGVFVAAALAATLAQVVIGRTDSRRGHGAQSLVLWGILLAATAAGAVWAERTIDPGVGRLVRAWAQPAAPGGDWAFVEGSARKDGASHSSYLLNLKTGRSLLLPFVRTATVSADGSRAVYVHAFPSPSMEVELKAIELEAIDLKTGDSVSMGIPKWPDGVALTADGRRLAIVSEGICRVVELPSLRLLASARIPVSPWTYVPRFVSPDTVRLHPFRLLRRAGDGSSPATRSVEDPEARELHVAKRSVTILARYPISSIAIPARKEKGVDRGPLFVLVPSPDLSLVLCIGAGSAHAVRLLDATSGRVLASVDGSEELGRPTGTFLADGRVVLVEPIPNGRRLVLLSPDGTRLSEIALPPNTSRVRLGFEPGKGLLSVGLTRGKQTGTWDWFLTNLETGTLRPLGADGLSPFLWSDGDRFPTPGSPVTRLAFDADRRLVLVDPETGGRTPLTRGQPRPK